MLQNQQGDHPCTDIFKLKKNALIKYKAATTVTLEDVQERRLHRHLTAAFMCLKGA